MSSYISSHPLQCQKNNFNLKHTTEKEQTALQKQSEVPVEISSPPLQNSHLFTAAEIPETKTSSPNLPSSNGLNSSSSQHAFSPSLTGFSGTHSHTCSPTPGRDSTTSSRASSPLRFSSPTTQCSPSCSNDEISCKNPSVLELAKLIPNEQPNPSSDFDGLPMEVIYNILLPYVPSESFQISNYVNKKDNSTYFKHRSKKIKELFNLTIREIRKDEDEILNFILHLEDLFKENGEHLTTESKRELKRLISCFMDELYKNFKEQNHFLEAFSSLFTLLSNYNRGDLFDKIKAAELTEHDIFSPSTILKSIDVIDPIDLRVAYFINGTKCITYGAWRDNIDYAIGAAIYHGDFVLLEILRHYSGCHHFCLFRGVGHAVWAFGKRISSGFDENDLYWRNLALKNRKDIFVYAFTRLRIFTTYTIVKAIELNEQSFREGKQEELITEAWYNGLEGDFKEVSNETIKRAKANGKKWKEHIKQELASSFIPPELAHYALEQYDIQKLLSLIRKQVSLASTLSINNTNSGKATNLPSKSRGVFSFLKKIFKR